MARKEKEKQQWAQNSSLKRNGGICGVNTGETVSLVSIQPWTYLKNCVIVSTTSQICLQSLWHRYEAEQLFLGSLSDIDTLDLFWFEHDSVSYFHLLKNPCLFSELCKLQSKYSICRTYTWCSVQSQSILRRILSWLEAGSSIPSISSLLQNCNSLLVLQITLTGLHPLSGSHSHFSIWNINWGHFSFSN